MEGLAIREFSIGTLLVTTHETSTRCKSVPLDANTSAARARVLGDRDTSMATFLNMFKKIAGVCRPVQTYQFHTRWQSVPHTLLAISGVPCKTAVRPWSCWGRTGNFSPGRQCVTPPLRGKCVPTLGEAQCSLSPRTSYIH